jgi:hypothetical protein
MPDVAPTTLLPAGNTPTSGSDNVFEIRFQPEYLIATINVAVVLSAAALVDATSLAVTALSAAIPANVLLHFSGGAATKTVFARTTAAAASGATGLSIEPLPAPLASAAATAWEGYYCPPLQGEIALTFSEQNADIDTYSSLPEVFGYGTITGRRYTIGFKTFAPKQDPVVRKMYTKGKKVGGAAIVNWRVTDGAGNFTNGDASLSLTAEPKPVRGAQEIGFMLHGQGRPIDKFVDQNT